MQQNLLNLDTLLSLSEALAVEYGLPDSEQMVSDMFDETIAPSVLKQYGADQVAFNEAFNNWTDSICKDGVISSSQYHHYCYIGEYSEL